MTRRPLLCLLASAALATLGCTDSTGDGGTGALTLQLTDAPFPFSEVTRVDVFIVRIDARRSELTTDESDETDMSDGWTTIASPNVAINLRDLVNGTTRALGGTRVPTGTYRGFRLVIDPSQSSITLRDGVQVEVQWPSLAKTGIRISLDTPISLTENGTVVVVDFDVGRSFVLRGSEIRSNGLRFKPVLRGTVVEMTGSASGTVRGDDQNGIMIPSATVEVLKPGTPLDDTDDANIVASTISDGEAFFRFGFLPPGTYVVRATPPPLTDYRPALLPGGLTIKTGIEVSGPLIVLPR